MVSYLEGLSKAGHRMHLVTFEPGRWSKERKAQTRAAMRARGIAWHRLRYRKRLSLLATVVDVLCAIPASVWWMRRHGLNTIHCRSHVPAAAGLVVRRITRCRLIFDIRGLMAEEYVDAGRWPAGGSAFRITKSVERAAIRSADGIVVLTERVRRLLFGPAGADPRVHVIPCCTTLADVAPPEADRERLPDAHRPTMIYVGKFTGWYMDEEMVELFARARARIPGLHFVILTQADAQHVLELLAHRGLPSTSFTVTQAPPDEVGGHLARASFAIALIRPSPSKISSSPTKIGEYLAAGLPVVSIAGVGDVDDLLAGTGAGVLLDVASLGPDTYDAAADEIAALASDASTAATCRSLARDHLSMARVGVPAYRALYRQVAAGRPQGLRSQTSS